MQRIFGNEYPTVLTGELVSDCKFVEYGFSDLEARIYFIATEDGIIDDTKQEYKKGDIIIRVAGFYDGEYHTELVAIHSFDQFSKLCADYLEKIKKLKK